MNYFLKANKNFLTYSLIILLVIPIFGINFVMSLIGNILLLFFLIPILFLILIFLSNLAPIKSEEKNNLEVVNLIKLLNKKGFKIKNDLPPKKRAYGLYENSTKTIWISPITKKLGIYKNVLVH